MIELIVVLGIVALVSTVIVFNYSKFRTTVTLRGLSQEVALAIRKAQTYATSVRSIDGAGISTASFPSYGIAFSADNPIAGDSTVPGRTRFILFADIPESGTVDGMYNDGGSCGSPSEGDECVEAFNITSTDRIVRLCTDGGCQTSGEIDVLFDRPAPDARLCVIDGGACASDYPSYLEVVIQSLEGSERSITVWNTGQISVE
jgi:type II secretory pathway pseudopilin PulG